MLRPFGGGQVQRALIHIYEPALGRGTGPGSDMETWLRRNRFAVQACCASTNTQIETECQRRL